MKASAIPAKFPIPFGSGAGTGYIRTIPVASQIGITPGAASLTDGMPPATFLPIGSGGTPPSGQDFNGILNQLSAWDQWTAAAGLVPWDSAFSSAIGGYPYSACVLSNSTPGRVWVSIADNNTVNPDQVGQTAWLALMLSSDLPTLVPPILAARNIVGAVPVIVQTTPGTYTYTVPAGVTLIRVRVWGAGGGGGGNLNQYCQAGGGCGGGFVDSTIPVTPGQVVTYIVGAGGVAGAVNGGNGGTGGTSSVSVPGQTAATATGGAYGFGASSGTSGSPQIQGTNAPPGSGSGGNIYNKMGGYGGAAFVTGNATNFVQAQGGYAEGSPQTTGGNNSAGVAGNAPGGGGGGSSAQGGAAGGAGANGRVELYTN